MNEFLEKEQELNLARARKEPVNTIIDCEVVESKRALDYPSNNVIVFVNGRVAFGEWLVGDE